MLQDVGYLGTIRQFNKIDDARKFLLAVRSPYNEPVGADMIFYMLEFEQLENMEIKDLSSLFLQKASLDSSG